MELELNPTLIGITPSKANLQLPDPDLRDFYRDEEERIFWFDSEVSDRAEGLIKMILRCNKEDKDKPIEDRIPIKIFIDSAGGDMVFMWTIINMIETSKTPVYTINYCTAYSAACEILASGHKRFALKGTHAMTHNGSVGYQGQADQVESMKKYFDKVSKKTTTHFLSKTKIDPKAFKRKAVVDWFMDEDEMLANGIVDKIVEDFDEIM